MSAKHLYFLKLIAAAITFIGVLLMCFALSGDDMYVVKEGDFVYKDDEYVILRCGWKSYTNETNGITVTMNYERCNIKGRTKWQWFEEGSEQPTNCKGDGQNGEYWYKIAIAGLVFAIFAWMCFFCPISKVMFPVFGSVSLFASAILIMVAFAHQTPSRHKAVCRENGEMQLSVIISIVIFPIFMCTACCFVPLMIILSGFFREV